VKALFPHSKHVTLYIVIFSGQSSPNTVAYTYIP